MLWALGQRDEARRIWREAQQPRRRQRGAARDAGAAAASTCERGARPALAAAGGWRCWPRCATPPPRRADATLDARPAQRARRRAASAAAQSLSAGLRAARRRPSAASCA
ncbi:MAG: hypothetical protein MZW92_62940 [Comamonadaceae bacterium]|nr:hypothetical protein [Comamonadaceae bacterium]